MNIHKIITESSKEEFFGTTIVAFYITTALLIYIFMKNFNYLFLNSEQQLLFKEYYEHNKIKSLHIDLIFILFYILTIKYLYEFLSNKKILKNVNKVAILIFCLIITTIVLDLLFVKLIRLRKTDSTTEKGKIKDFFNRWANAAGWKAVVWDIFYIGIVLGVTLLMLNKETFLNKLPIHILLMLIVLIHFFY